MTRPFFACCLFCLVQKGAEVGFPLVWWAVDIEEKYALVSYLFRYDFNENVVNVCCIDVMSNWGDRFGNQSRDLTLTKTLINRKASEFR